MDKPFNVKGTDFTVSNKEGRYAYDYVDKITGNVVTVYGNRDTGMCIHLLEDIDIDRFGRIDHKKESVIGTSGHFKFRYVSNIDKNRRFVAEGILIDYTSDSENGYLDIVKLDIDSMEYRFITQVLGIDKS